jgi:hypothetical protein
MHRGCVEAASWLPPDAHPSTAPAIPLEHVPREAVVQCRAEAVPRPVPTPPPRDTARTRREKRRSLVGGYVGSSYSVRRLIRKLTAATPVPSAEWSVGRRPGVDFGGLYALLMGTTGTSQP